VALPSHKDPLFLVGRRVYHDLGGADGLKQLDDVDLVEVTSGSVHEETVEAIGLGFLVASGKYRATARHQVVDHAIEPTVEVAEHKLIHNAPGVHDLVVWDSILGHVLQDVDHVHVIDVCLFQLNLQ